MISWTNHSQVADTLLLERGVNGPTGPGDWTALPAAFGATSYVDALCPELRSCSYRLRYGRNGIWSREASLAIGPMPLRQPRDLRAELTAAGVALSWSNLSTAAAGIAVHCSPCAGGATLPPGASTYVDPWVPPWPSVRYWVEAFRGAPVQTFDPGPLPVAELPPFRIAGPVATLDARAATIPPSVALRRDPRSTFSYTTYGAGGAEVVRSDGGMEERHPLPHALYVPPSLLLDGAGNPHVVTQTEPDGTGSLLLAHDWHDGSAWHTDEIGPLSAVFPEARFGVSASGDLHIIYQRTNAPFSSELTHGVLAGGGWWWAPVPGMFRADEFAVAEDGTAYALGVAQTLVIATLPAGGTWSVEQIPPASPTLANDLVTGPTGRVGILGIDTPIGFDRHLLYVERADGKWSAPEMVGPLAVNYLGFSRTISADGARLLVTATVPDESPAGAGVVLYGRSAGAWSGMRLAPGPGAPLLGYGADGKLWIAGGGGLWEEP